MRFAYADPPYLGCAKFYAELHPEAMAWDDPETHRALIVRLCSEFPDGWALSLHVPSLRAILPMCPEDVRVCSWVKPFASFKKGVKRAWTWEPVIVRGGRQIDAEAETVRDHVSCGITLQRGFVGAKPDGFCYWLFRFLGAQPEDELVDLFPGSGAVTRAWGKWRDQGNFALVHAGPPPSAPAPSEETHDD